MRAKRQRMDDLTRWRIEQLGMNGGFAHRYIAATALGRSIDEVDETDLNRIRHVLKQREIRVIDWRNGQTLLARSHAKNALKAKARARRRRRAG